MQPNQVEPQKTYSTPMKITATVIIITFTMLILEPTAVAAQVLHQEYQQAVAKSAQEQAVKLADTLKTVETTLLNWQNQLTTPSRQRRPLSLQNQAKTLKQQVIAFDESVQADFQGILAHLQSQQLPQTILQRHFDTVASYQQNITILLNNLEAMITAQDETQFNKHLESALQHLQPLLTAGGHPHFDPNNLPFNVPKAEVRAPLEDESALKNLLPTDTSPQVRRQTKSPDHSYLQATPDIQITTDIKALAQELAHNPVNIYNWVHDNIQFIPTYGSTQGSQLTLENRAGNATDTASLLIALLRTSGIHARYAYGSVLMPIDKVMNWVGGVTTPEAAIQLLGQGGVPVSSVINKGQIAFIKMEHIWVEAFVDYYPSRGARHRRGDSWIPMDPSWKQYQFVEGMDIQNNVSFNAEAFVKQLTQDAEINEAEGWVSGLDQNLMETTLQNYQTQIETHITQTNPEATVGDVLGTQTIIPSTRPKLAAGLPYTVVAKGNTFKELPANLRHHFKFSLYQNERDRILDNPAFTFTESLPNLAGKRLTLSFEPATDNDRQVIESYLPDIPPGQEPDLNDLPTSLPGYLIRLKAQLKLDSEVVAESSGFMMGQELSSTTGITRMTGGWHLAHNKPIAGEFYAFGIDGQGISAKQLETVKARMETVKTKLENQQFEGLTKDDLIGDMLYAGALSYFAANDANLEILNKGEQALAYRQPSFGTFSTNLNPIYSFGVPRQVETNGIMVDMDAVIQSLWTKDNNIQLVKTFVQRVGIISSFLEHEIPELLFSNDESQGKGISAVKALAIASTQGQRIYQVTQENINTVLPELDIDSEVKNEIQVAVTVGKIAIVSQNNMTVGSWTGVGYIIYDPQTGTGAYRIGGGYNGSTYEDGFWTGIGIVGLVSSFLFFSNFTPLLAFLFIAMIAFSIEQSELNLKRGGKGGTVGDFWLGTLCGFTLSLVFLSAFYVLKGIRLAKQTTGLWEIFELLIAVTTFKNITPCTDDY